jgi:hypothetical protein
MSTQGPKAPSGRSFEDDLLAALLAVHDEVQRAQPKLAKRARSRGLRPGRRPPPGTWAYSAATGTGPGRGAVRRTALGVLVISAAVVAGALVLASVRSAGQKVTVTPGAGNPGGAATITAPGTIFVANAGAGNGADGTGRGSVTAYRPGVTGNKRPEVVITKGIDTPNSLTFDSSGDLWVTNSTSNTVVEYSKAELAKASPVPTVTISGTSLDSPATPAFDRSGDLWVSNNSTVVEFTKAQLSRSASPTPAVTLGISACGIAFDPSGDLWGGSKSDTVFEWAKAQLSKSGSPAPRVTINSVSLNMPCQPTFGPAGDMWAANSQGTTAVELTKAQLAKSGSPNAWVTVSPSAGLVSPGNVALDPKGDLWVPNSGANAVVEFAKAQLAKSGFPAPATAIIGLATHLNWPWAVTIEP